MAEEPIWVDSKGSSTSCDGLKGVHFGNRNIHLEVCEETNIRGDFMRGRSERGERSEHIRVNFSRVSLRSNGVGVFEPGELSNKGVELFNLVRCQ